MPATRPPTAASPVGWLVPRISDRSICPMAGWTSLLHDGLDCLALPAFFIYNGNEHEPEAEVVVAVAGKVPETERSPAAPGGAEPGTAPKDPDRAGFGPGWIDHGFG